MKKFFGKIGAWMKKHKKLTIFLIILLVIGGLILYIGSKVKEAQEILNAMYNSSEVATIEKRSLVESLSATGTVISKDSEDVIALVQGVEVKEIPVSVGDRVNAGDILCILDSTDLETQVNNLETSLKASKQNSNSSIASSGRLLNENKDTRNTQVGRDYEDAQLRFNDYEKAVADADKAQQEYDSAVNEYNWRASDLNSFLDNHPGMSDYDFAMTKDPQVAQDYNFYKGKYDSAKSMMESKEKALETAKKSRDQALETYNKTVRTYEDHLTNNDSSIMSRNDSLINAKTQSTTVGLNEELQIKQYKDQINECTVLAPYSGIITNITAVEGTKYAGTTIMTIEDDSAYKITAQIDEYDIAKVKVGQRVVIKTNGTGDLELEGKVSEVAPRATKSATTGTVSTTQSITYAVKIDVITPCDSLKMDMTAKLSIILNEKDNVLTVPYDAVQTDDEGRLYIEKNVPKPEGEGRERAGRDKSDRNGQQTDPKANRIYITKGIESDYYIEVIGDGVVEGVEIVVPSKNGGNDFMRMMMNQGPMGGF